MAFHPCCGGSLQSGTKIVAILQIIAAVLFVCGSIFMAIIGVTFVSVAHSGGNGTAALIDNVTNSFHIPKLGNDTNNPDANSSTTALTVALGIFILVTLITSVCSLLLGIVLWQGAKQRNLKKCRIWLVIRSILMVISFVSFLGNLISHGSYGGKTSETAIGLILDFYCMWVVYAFIDELREDEDASIKRSMYTIKA